MRAREILAHDHPSQIRRGQETSRQAAAAVDPRLSAGGVTSHVHEAEPGGARLEVPGAAALAAAAAVGRAAADPLQQQGAHGPPLRRSGSAGPRPTLAAAAAAAARRGRPVGPVPVADAAERPRVVRRRAEACQLLAAAAGSRGGSRTSSNGAGRRAGCRGHVRCCVGV